MTHRNWTVRRHDVAANVLPDGRWDLFVRHDDCFVSVGRTDRPMAKGQAIAKARGILWYRDAVHELRMRERERCRCLEGA